MKKSLQNYQFFKSFRLPISIEDKVFADICSNSSETKSCRHIRIDSINLSGLNFTSDTNFIIGEDVKIKVFTKRIFNNWDFELEGVIVRSFISELDETKKVYGVLLKKQNKESVLNYFLKDFIHRFNNENLKKHILMSCRLDRELNNGENIELFSLFNSILNDIKTIPFEAFLKDLNRAFNCENYYIYLFDQAKGKLVNYKSNATDDLLKTDHKLNIYMSYENENLLNLKFNENNKSKINLKNLLCFPIQNKNFESVGVFVLRDSHNAKGFNLSDEISIRFVSKIISYYTKDFSTHANQIKKKEAKDLELFYGNSRIALELKNASDTLKNVSKNLLILGEKGSRKMELATFMHENGKHKNEELKVIDFSAKHLIQGFIDNLESYEICPRSSVVIKEIGNLNNEQQVQIYLYLKNKNARFITISSIDLYHQVKANKFSKQLYSFLSELFLHIPALRNRKNDLIEIADIIIQKECKHRQIEKKVLSTFSLQEILRYNWPGNFDELKNEITKSLMKSEDHEKDIHLNLKNDKTIQNQVKKNHELHNLLKSMVSHADKSIDYDSHLETLEHYIQQRKVS